MNKLIDDIDNILPQTQCTRCGYPSCKDYANAIANKEADINQCPPGGVDGINKLAKLLGTEYKELNPNSGQIGPQKVARIIEDECIGCTLCIKACPVDAIVGSNKMMHTVIESYCTGCDLCIKACPVDCIEMENRDNSLWSKHDQELARVNFNARQNRLKKAQAKRMERLGKYQIS